MTINKDELRRLAEAATPGPWKYRVPGEVVAGTRILCRPNAGAANLNIAEQQERSRSNAKLIAAANPATILALLDELEAAQRDAGRYRYLRSLSYEDSTEGEWTVGICESFKFPRNADHENAIDQAIDAAMQEQKP